MITIGGHQLTIEELYGILFGEEKIALEQQAMEEVEKNFNFLESFADQKIIYGINTGLGPMSQYKVDEKDREALQYNLIRSHAAGAGEIIPHTHIKAIMVARLNSLMRAYSGIHPEVPELIKNLINENISPIIPSHGGVGASGDLVQLAHLALTLIGEGDVLYEGRRQKTAEVFKARNLKPISIHIREALALINGTSAMTGIGVMNIVKARQLLNWAIAASAMINEIVESYDDHYSYNLNKVKLHFGQAEITEKLQQILSDSKCVRKREDHLFNGNGNGDKFFSKKIQEYYSIRCITQILGPISDTINYSEKIILNEINSVNDNPIIDHKNNNVYHGGNFHGDYIALEMDKLRIAITKLSMLVERQLNFLMNKNLNAKLPPFINLGTLGLNLGMQGMQFTATSTTAENQTLSNPMYIHSIPTNGDNQDVVSMGSNAALLTKKVIENTFDVISIHLIALIQSIDYLEYQENLSTFTKKIYDDLRQIVPKFVNDDVRYPDIEKINHFIKNNPLDL